MLKSKAKAVVLLSGGQDSTTCLYAAIDRWGRDAVIPLSVFYGQKHHLELESASQIASMAGLREVHEIIQLPEGVLKSISPLVDHQTPVAQYVSAEVLPGGLEATFVPLRNLLFLTLAANRAVYHKASVLVTGVSQEDFGGYPDCRGAFLNAAESAIHEALGNSGLCVWAPVLTMSKAETVKLAVRLLGCMDALAYSHTCYNGVSPPCGHCHACLLRERGFREAGIVDPLIKRLGEGA